ncbi:MAG: ATP-binding cassette domain-containing protein [Bacilli bacterium]|nr:ATP-binding cassette domain-containing protein [Bacilli bacterium]
MEITFKNIDINNNSFTIKEKEINGIITNQYEKIENLFLLYNNIDDIEINHQKIKKSDIKDYKKKISIIKKRINPKDYYLTCYEILLKEIKRKELKLKDTNKKIIDSLKIVGMNQSLQDRQIFTLSSKEKKYLQLAISLISNPEIIIIEDAFDYLDMKNEKKVFLLLQRIKDQYNKTIVFVSNKTEKIYQYSTHVIIYLSNKIIIEGKTEELFKKVDILKENKVEVPEIVEFTNKAIQNKKVKIDYHKDVRDIIKDIYKHV